MPYDFSDLIPMYRGDVVDSMKIKTMTQSDFDNLPPEEKKDGTVYCITDNSDIWIADKSNYWKVDTYTCIEPPKATVEYKLTEPQICKCCGAVICNGRVCEYCGVEYSYKEVTK